MEIINNIGLLLGRGCAVSLLLLIYIIIWKKGHEFYDDLRGMDKVWQAIELSIVAWCLIFPHIAVCSILGLDVPNGLWTSMNSVFLISVGGKVVGSKISEKLEQDERKQ